MVNQETGSESLEIAVVYVTGQIHEGVYFN